MEILLQECNFKSQRINSKQNTTLLAVQAPAALVSPIDFKIPYNKACD